MSMIQDGQCGLCTHFGEGDMANEKLVTIRTSRQAPETFVETCGLPKYADLHLKVTPISGCDAFRAAA